MKPTATLTFRAYALKELACLYFPENSARDASRRLRLLIHQDPLLYADLLKHGYRPRIRIFAPILVQVLLQHLGHPEAFYEIVRHA